MTPAQLETNPMFAYPTESINVPDFQAVRAATIPT